jgi:hypothetical protein
MDSQTGGTGFFRCLQKDSGLQFYSAFHGSINSFLLFVITIQRNIAKGPKKIVGRIIKESWHYNKLCRNSSTQVRIRQVGTLSKNTYDTDLAIKAFCGWGNFPNFIQR